MLKSEQEVLQRLILDTVTMLCRNTVNYHNSLQVQGLIGVTLDNNVFIVHFNENFDKVDTDENLEPKSNSDGTEFGLQEFHSPTNNQEISIRPTLTQEMTHETQFPKRFSGELTTIGHGRQKQHTTSHNDTQGSEFTGLVKEEVDEETILSHSWSGFQMETAESSIISEQQMLTFKVEPEIVESELPEIPMSEIPAFGMHSQVNQMVSGSLPNFDQLLSRPGNTCRQLQPPDVMIESVEPQKMRQHMIRGGYKYRKDRINGDGSVSWRCVRKECRGRIRIMDDNDVVKFAWHSHPPNETKSRGAKVLERMHLLAKSGAKKQLQVLEHEAGEDFSEISVSLPSCTSDPWTVRPKRKCQSQQRSDSNIKIEDE